VLKQTLKVLKRALCDQRAQVTVEYALVIAVFVALLLGVSAAVLSGLSSHYREVTSVVSLPIP